MFVNLFLNLSPYVFKHVWVQLNKEEKLLSRGNFNGRSFGNVNLNDKFATIQKSIHEE